MTLRSGLPIAIVVKANIKVLGVPVTTLHMLLLSADQGLVTTFTDLSKELGIEAQCTMDSREMSEQLSRAKYEGVLLDFDTIADARPVLARVRESCSNKNAIVFAVATEVGEATRAINDRAHF